MNDRILPLGPQGSAQSEQTTDHAQFRRPTEAEPLAESLRAAQRAEQSAAPSRVPGSTTPLLSVLPTAFPVGEPEAPPVSDEPAPEEPPAAPDEAEAAPAPVQRARLFPNIRWTKPRMLGAVAALLLIVLLLDQVLMPYLRYRKAVRQEEAGNYEQAVSLYAALDGYRDSARRIDAIELEDVRVMMNEGRYQEALDVLEARPTTSMLIADCLYALGVLAYNDGDAKKGLEYVDQLRERFPKYDKATLEQYCCYTLGNQYAAKANEVSAPFQKTCCYEEAIGYYSRAAGYSDCADRIKECRYQIAWNYAAEWKLEDAIELFTELKHYRDADELRQSLMYDYVLSHVESGLDQTAKEYLNLLAAADYSGAVQLRNLLNGVGFSFELVYGEDGAPLPDEITSFADVFIRYEITARDGDAALPVEINCTLPNGKSSWAYLNEDGSASGVVALNQLFLGTLSSQKSGYVLLTFSAPYYALKLETLSFQYCPPNGGD